MYQRGEPELSKMTLYGCPPPPRLSRKMGSGSGLKPEVVMLMKGKSLGTETPLAMVVAKGWRCAPLRISGARAGADDVEEEVIWLGGLPGRAAMSAESGRCPEMTNWY